MVCRIANAAALWYKLFSGLGRLSALIVMCKALNRHARAAVVESPCLSTRQLPCARVAVASVVFQTSWHPADLCDTVASADVAVARALLQPQQTLTAHRQHSRKLTILLLFLQFFDARVLLRLSPRLDYAMTPC
ncbi:hypothetical protein COO60DRAFT_939025 [Scenedesmus sp. NREL 46B-D3]|nr:hypothetical protein COO60DRAFT_939025 [Scenedesmus sp. NREL 46B-D3]